MRLTFGILSKISAAIERFPWIWVQTFKLPEGPAYWNPGKHWLYTSKYQTDLLRTFCRHDLHTWNDSDWVCYAQENIFIFLQPFYGHDCQWGKCISATLTALAKTKSPRRSSVPDSLVLTQIRCTLGSSVRDHQKMMSTHFLHTSFTQ